MYGLATLLGGVLWFALGACIGSFLNVVIYRTEHDENWMVGRSHCDNCGKQIAWYDNIPLLSFALLGGKCRACKKPISKAHPVVETLFGFLFMWWWLLGSFFFRLTEQPFSYIQPLFWLLVGGIFIYIFVEDLISMTIPIWSVFTLVGMALLYRLALVLSGIMQVQDFLTILIAAFLITLLFYVLHVGTRGRGMGMGDVLLSFPLVVLVGWPRALVWFFLAFTLGAVIGTGMLLFGKAKFRQRIPFGPFMVASAVITLLFGEALFGWYLQFLL